VQAAAKVSRDTVDRTERRLTTDAKLFNKFPELRDPKSELFKETSERFKEAVAIDKSAEKRPGALYLAPKAAQEHLDRKARLERRRREDDEDEADRGLRARWQDGRGSGRGTIDDDDMLGSEALEVISKMGISEKAFKEQRETRRRR